MKKTVGFKILHKLIQLYFKLHCNNRFQAVILFSDVNKKAILKKLKRVNRSRRGYYCVTLTYTMYCTPCTFLSPLSSYGWIGVPEDEEYQLMDPVLHPEYDTNM